MHCVPLVGSSVYPAPQPKRTRLEVVLLCFLKTVMFHSGTYESTIYLAECDCSVQESIEEDFRKIFVIKGLGVLNVYAIETSLFSYIVLTLHVKGYCIPCLRLYWISLLLCMSVWRYVMLLLIHT